MKNQYIAAIFLVIIFVLIGLGRRFRAEAVDHHGTFANVGGTRDECLSCHNDVKASRPGKCMPVCVFGDRHGPIYGDYPPVNNRGEFQPLAVVQKKGLVLRNGRIDCITCHDLTSKNSHHLRIDSWQLCKACHVR